MLERIAGLSERDLEAIAELEQQVVEADGGRLKLEWGMLRRRSGERVEDLLWWEGDRLLGFLGFYGCGSSLELAGMVAPDSRRRGIGTALLDAAAPLYRGRGCQEALLIVPRASAAGRCLALRGGAVLAHSEHALVLSEDPASGPHQQSLCMRPAIEADIADISRVLAEGFSEPPRDDLAAGLDSPHERTMVVEVSGATVGTLRVTRDGDDAAIYAFAIAPSWQGRGLGRDALRRACAQLRAEGARRIRLEVAVENDRALSLYTSVGFKPVTTEDYYSLPLS